MNSFLKADASVRRMMIGRVQEQVKLPPQSIEKDYWVTQVLHLLFSLPVGGHMVFKGGTSLSKAWGLIERFSEDIDLAMDPVFLGSPVGEPTKKQIKALRKASSLYVVDELVPMLRARIQDTGLSDLLTVKAQPDGEGDNTYPEPRQIYVEYRSLYQDKLSYLRPMIVLEIGARSLLEPVAEVDVKSILSDHLPVEDISPVNVVTAVAGKTFLEKAFLLHELFSIEGRGMKAERKSRHMYDLYKMMGLPFAAEAIRDDALWESIRHHREIYTSVSGMDYTPDVRERLVLVPRSDIMDAWRQDYETMKDAMIYGDKPSWDELIEAMRELQERMRRHL